MSKIIVKKTYNKVFKPIDINMKITIESREELDDLRKELQEGELSKDTFDVEHSLIVYELIEKLRNVI